MSKAAAGLTGTNTAPAATTPARAPTAASSRQRWCVGRGSDRPARTGARPAAVARSRRLVAAALGLGTFVVVSRLYWLGQ
jgi:hypothetical protein